MSEMADMKTLTMAGKTYVVHDEVARAAAAEAKEIAVAGPGAVATVGVMEIDDAGTLKIENLFETVDSESGELDRYATEGDVSRAVSAHDTDTGSHEDIRALAVQAQTSAVQAQTSADSKAPAYSYGTTDLTAGVSELETGKLHFVYE